MVRVAGLFLVAVSLEVALSTSTVAQENDPFEGAWLLERIEGPDGNVLEDPQPGLILFTDGHFSFTMAAPPNVTRPTYSGDTPTEAEKARAYETFEAGAGPYEVEGDSLVTRAYLHVDPNAMDQWPKRIRKYKVQVERDTLYWHFGQSVGVYRSANGMKPPH